MGFSHSIKPKFYAHTSKALSLNQRNVLNLNQFEQAIVAKLEEHFFHLAYVAVSINIMLIL